jgi:hypothetical protein
LGRFGFPSETGRVSINGGEHFLEHDKGSIGMSEIADLSDARRAQRGEIRVTVVLSPNGPPKLVLEPRGVKLSDLNEAYYVLQSAFSAKFRSYGLQGETLSERILDAIDTDWNIRHIRKWVEKHKDELKATRLPWKCEAEECDRRFETERGTKIHERSCHHLTGKPEPVSNSSGFDETSMKRFFEGTHDL